MTGKNMNQIYKNTEFVISPSVALREKDVNKGRMIDYKVDI